jgi:hypothetical protein
MPRPAPSRTIPKAAPSQALKPVRGSVLPLAGDAVAVGGAVAVAVSADVGDDAEVVALDAEPDDEAGADEPEPLEPEPLEDV